MGRGYRLSMGAAIEQEISRLEGKLTPPNAGLPSGVNVIDRLTVTFRESEWLDAGKAIKAAAKEGNVVVYRLKDRLANDVLKVGIDNPASLPEVWRRYKNASDRLPHRQLELEVTIVESTDLVPKLIERAVSDAYQNWGYRLTWSNEHPLLRLGRRGPGIPYFRQSNLAKLGWDWVDQGQGLDPIYLRMGNQINNIS